MKTMLKMSVFTLFIYLFLFSSYSYANASNICEHTRLKRTIENNKKNSLLLIVIYKDRNNIFKIGSGTAFVINKSGILATARHIFLGKIIVTVYVVIPDGNKLFIKEPYFVRIHKKADVAILKINHKFKSQVKMSRSNKLNSSDLIYYIGYPAISGNLLISQKIGIGYFFGHRIYNNRLLNLYYLSQFSVIPALGGASGSPVFDSYGKLIGVIAFIAKPHYHGSSFTGSVPNKYLLELLSKKSNLYIDSTIESHI